MKRNGDFNNIFYKTNFKYGNKNNASISSISTVSRV